MTDDIEVFVEFGKRKKDAPWVKLRMSSSETGCLFMHLKQKK